MPKPPDPFGGLGGPEPPPASPAPPLHLSSTCEPPPSWSRPTSGAGVCASESMKHLTVWMSPGHKPETQGLAFITAQVQAAQTVCVSSLVTPEVTLPALCPSPLNGDSCQRGLSQSPPCNQPRVCSLILSNGRAVSTGKGFLASRNSHFLLAVPSTGRAKSKLLRKPSKTGAGEKKLYRPVWAPTASLAPGSAPWPEPQAKDARP